MVKNVEPMLGERIRIRVDEETREILEDLTRSLSTFTQTDRNRLETGVGELGKKSESVDNRLKQLEDESKRRATEIVEHLQALRPKGMETPPATEAQLLALKKSLEEVLETSRAPFQTLIDESIPGIARRLDNLKPILDASKAVQTATSSIAADTSMLASSSETIGVGVAGLAEHVKKLETQLNGLGHALSSSRQAADASAQMIAKLASDVGAVSTMLKDVLELTRAVESRLGAHEQRLDHQAAALNRLTAPWYRRLLGFGGNV